MTFTSRRRWLTALLLAGIGAVWLLRGELPAPEAIGEGLDALGPAAPPAAVLLFAGASLLGTPGTLLVAAAVWAFGFGGGVAVSAGGALLAAASAFWIARAIGRERVLAWIAERHRWRRLDEAIGRRGAWVVFLLRLLPSLPFTLLNYLLGLTRVRFGAYLAATAVGIVPNLLVFAYAAEEVVVPATRGIAPWRQPGFWWAVPLAGLVLVALPLAVRRLAAGRRGGDWLGLLAGLRRPGPPEASPLTRSPDGSRRPAPGREP